ncbi:MAG: ribokinase [Candidatus Schekmanbacteria bacterium]|nr:ribokinase [Candidatus Schekmanbacteria bacterium]
MKKKVLVVGSSNIDLTLISEKLPRPGETITADKFMIFYGGKGANQAIAARKAGADVNFITRLGTDASGKDYRARLLKFGFPSGAICEDKKVKTGTALITVNKKGENLISVYQGSNKNLSPADIRKNIKYFAESCVLLLQFEIPFETVCESLKIAKKLGLTTIVNPAPARKIPENVYKLIDVITPNIREAVCLSGKNIRTQDDIKKSALILSKKGPSTVIITLGNKGIALFHNGVVKFIKAPKVKAIDTTGAGDAFNGALAAFLSESFDMTKSAKMAICAAALSVQKAGAQTALPARSEIDKFYKKVGLTR